MTATADTSEAIEYKKRQTLQSKVVRNLEVCTNAESKVEGLFTDVLDTLRDINHRLIDIAVELSKAQPMENGSVVLDLQPCSREGCRGCPHPRWLRCFWRMGARGPVLVQVNLGAKNMDPIRKLNPKAKNYEQAKTLIREAKALIKRRSELIARLRPLEYTLRKY